MGEIKSLDSRNQQSCNCLHTLLVVLGHPDAKTPPVTKSHRTDVMLASAPIVFGFAD